MVAWTWDAEVAETMRYGLEEVGEFMKRWFWTEERRTERYEVVLGKERRLGELVWLVKHWMKDWRGVVVAEETRRVEDRRRIRGSIVLFG